MTERTATRCTHGEVDCDAARGAIRCRKCGATAALPSSEPVDSLGAAWAEAEAAALLWADGANLYDLTVFRQIERVGAVAAYTAMATRYEHREPNGPSAESQEAEADGPTPAAALRALAARLAGNPS